MAEEPQDQEEVGEETVTIGNPEEFDSVMLEIGYLQRGIDLLEHNRNAAVAELDRELANARGPLVKRFNPLFDAAKAFVDEPDNKARMTTAKAPQTADRINSVVKWVDDHNGTIVLAEGKEEQAVIRSLLHRKGGSKFIKTTRTLDWKKIRASAEDAFKLGGYFTRVFEKTRTTLYIKPATTPKPDGKDANRKIERLS